MSATNSLFPRGEENKAYSQYFSGISYLAALTNNPDCLVSNVTFEPGCRNNWHTHGGGQILLCVNGRGWYQEEGQPARELHPGDVADIPADVKHWHGAAKDSWFEHIAIAVRPDKGICTWMEPVSDEQYNALEQNG